MGIRKDKTGLKFHKLKVIGLSHMRNGMSYWNCLCDCGKTIVVRSNSLNENTKSCGCLNHVSKRIELVGQRFGRLSVVSFAGLDKKRVSRYDCVCDCGKTITVVRSSLVKGLTKSCGCLLAESSKSRFGDKHPNWNSGLSDYERKHLRAIEGYSEWLYAVKKRDNFTCKSCGEAKWGRLVSHHLDSYRDFPNKRTDLSNGVCLCEDCHKRFHTMYGYKGNTKKQFEEFVRNKNE